MKPLTKKGERIIENIFDVMMETTYHNKAKVELRRDLNGHNVSVDKGKGLITIEDEQGLKILYSIKIEKV